MGFNGASSANLPFAWVSGLHHPFDFFYYTAALQHSRSSTPPAASFTTNSNIKHAFYFQYLSIVCAWVCYVCLSGWCTCIDPVRHAWRQQVLPREPQMLSSSPCVTMVMVPSATCCVCSLHCQKMYTQTHAQRKRETHTQAGEAGFGEAGPVWRLNSWADSNRAEWQTDRYSCSLQSVSLCGEF